MLHVLDPKVLQADYFRQLTREVWVLVSDAHIGLVILHLLIVLGENTALIIIFTPFWLWVTL